jgi:sialic acid synthase SpsE
MMIGSFDTNKNILLIAEIGNNHEGSVTLAEELIGKAAEAGAHAVKFQTIVPEELISASRPERITQLKRFQLSRAEFRHLAGVAQAEGVLFLSTPFDRESVHFLNPLVPAFKIASGDLTFFPLLKEVAGTGKQILLSTGMADMQEIARTRDFVFGIWESQGIRAELALLHCVSCYPTLPQNANLSAIQVLAGMGLTVGYSDHTLGIEAAVLSAAVGARIIEKHFTMDKKYSDFRDHQLSADPGEFSRLVHRVMEVSELLGSGEKVVGDCEQEGRVLFRRSIVAREDLEPGVRISWEQLAWVRPGGGLPPGSEGELIGRKMKRAVPRGGMILPADVEQD